MSTDTLRLDGELANYVRRLGLREHPALRALREETEHHAHGSMRSSAEQVGLLAFLIETIGARHVLEVGCFTGYGTLGMALALPEDGRLTTLDVNDEWAAIGRRFWAEAGVADRISFRSGLALDSMDELVDQGAVFDFIYIDADKKTYPDYYDRALKLVRQGGLIALDNMLRSGAVVDDSDQSRQTVAIRELTEQIHADPGVALSLNPVGDGVMLVRRR